VLKKDFLRIAINKYGNKFDYSLLPNILNYRKKETIICQTHGKFDIVLRDHIRTKHGCRKCFIDNFKTSESIRMVNNNFIIKSSNKFNNKFKYIVKDDVVLITCPLHGELQSDIRNHYYSKTGCRKCAIKYVSNNNIKIKNLHDVKEALEDIYGDTYVYNLNSYKDLSSIIKVKCKVHGVFRVNIRTFLKGKGCRKCNYNKIVIDKDMFLERSINIHGDVFTYDLTYYKNTSSVVKLTHECGYTFYRKARKHLEGQRCPKCKVSKGEEKISDFLDINNLNFTREYKINGYLYRYDFYIPKLKLLIEYDGEQHFRSSAFWGGEKKLKKVQESDKIKNKLAKLNGYYLIRIKYTEFKYLENSLLNKLSLIYPYCVNGMYYKSFLQFCKENNVCKDTKKDSIERYLLKNNISLRSANV